MSALETSHDYARRGWGVVPLHGYDADTGTCRCSAGRFCPEKNRGKHPVLKDWAQRPLESGGDIQAWYDDHPTNNVGILTGPKSGIFVLDVDGAKGVRTVSDLASEHGSLPPTRIVRTGSGGLHYFFRHPGHFTVHGSTSWVGPGVDIRGWGGQVVAPPSISGRGPYELIADHPPAEAPQWLLDLLREHSEHCEHGRSAEVRGAEPVDVALMPDRLRTLASTVVGEDQGRFTHFHGLVATCYEHGYTQGQTVTIVAPWCAAVDKFVGRVEAEVARSWGKLDAEARRQNDWIPGIAGPRPAQPQQDDSDNSDDPDPDPDPGLPTTWQPVDLTDILNGTYTPETSTVMPRTDGHCLLYPGRTHSFHGESESGKSLVIQAECARLVTNDQDVLYIDFESDAPAVIGRLLDLGTDPDKINNHLTYIRPDTDPRKFAHEREALAKVLASTYTLAAIDGMTDALGVFGASSKDNDEVSAFMRAVPRLIASKTGAAVVVIDHVAKDSDTRGRFAIGGQAKMASLDGAAYIVEITDALGRGMRGVITLRVAKDRPGGIRPECGKFRASDRTQEATRVVVDSTSGTTIVTLEQPRSSVTDTGDHKPTRLTRYMERVSLALTQAVRPLSQKELEDLTGGNSRHVRSASTTLATEGYIRVETGPRNARLHVHMYPYREADDPESDAYVGWAEDPTSATSADLGHTSAKSGADDLGQGQAPLTGPGRGQRGSKHTHLGQPRPTNNTTPSECSSCRRPVPKTNLDALNGLCASCAMSGAAS